MSERTPGIVVVVGRGMSLCNVAAG